MGLTSKPDTFWNSLYEPGTIDRASANDASGRRCLSFDRRASIYRRLYTPRSADCQQCSATTPDSAILQHTIEDIQGKWGKTLEDVTPSAGFSGSRQFQSLARRNALTRHIGRHGTSDV